MGETQERDKQERSPVIWDQARIARVRKEIRLALTTQLTSEELAAARERLKTMQFVPLGPSQVHFMGRKKEA